MAVASAATTHEKVRFRYAKPGGDPARRLAEPHHLVAVGRRWYLVAFDEDREDWRTFRVDRMSDVHRTGVRVPPRALPDGMDAGTWVMRSLSARPGTTRALLLLHVPLEEATRRIPGWLGTLDRADATSCHLNTAAARARAAIAAFPGCGASPGGGGDLLQT